MTNFTTSRAKPSVDRIRDLADVETMLRTIALAMAVLFLRVTDLERYDLYYSNQNTYFPSGLHMSGREFLQHDWFAQTRPPHLAFSYLVAGLDRLHILAAGATALQALLEAALLLAIWLIISALYRRFDRDALKPATNSSRLALRTVAFGLLLLGMLHRSFLHDRLNAWRGPGNYELGWIWQWTFSLDGLATQYVWGRFLQPSEFGILLLLAIGVMLIERWRLGSLLLGLAAIMHTGYLPHAALLALLATGCLVRSGRRRIAAESLLIFTGVTLPVVIYALTFAFQPGSAEALDILVNFRTPHHSIPAEWWSNSSMVQLALMAAASLIALWKWRGFLALVLATGFVYTVTSILLVTLIIDSDTLAFAHPWRGSAYLVPLSLVVVVASAVAGAERLLQRLGEQPRRMEWFAAAASLLLLVAIFVRTTDTEDHRGPGPRWNIAVMVREHTDDDDIIMIPADWYDFRMEAERPIYVDHKSHPYLASEVLEWWRRFEVNRRFYEAPESERGEICIKEEIDYYVISANSPTTVHRQLAEAQGHVLVACPGVRDS